MPKSKHQNVKQGLTKQTQQRRDAGIQLRQTRRHDQVNKRRRGGSPQTGPREDFELRYAKERISGLIALASQKIGESERKRDAEGKENGAGSRGAALTQLRLLLIDDNAPISRFMKAGIMDVLVPVIVHKEAFEIEQQHEALWCLTNIACDEYAYTKQVFALAPYLVSLLSCGHAELQEQAAWCLANLAGEDAELREQLFKMQVVEPLVALFVSEREKTVQLAAWALVNLMKGPIFPVSAFLETDVFKLIGRHLSSNNDALLSEVLWILAILAAAEEKCVDLICNEGLVPVLISVFINQTDPLVVMPCLRCIASVITSRYDEFASQLPSLVPVMIQHLNSFHKGVLKETATALATFSSVPLLANHLLPTVSAACALFVRARFDTRKEIALLLLKLALLEFSDDGPAVVFHTTSSCTSSSSLSLSSDPVSDAEAPEPSSPLFRIVSFAGVLDGILDLLKSYDFDSSFTALNFVELVLRHVPRGVKIIEEKNGIELLETFQTSQNQQLYDFAMNLVDSFYGEDCGFEEEERMRGSEREKGNQANQYPPWRQQALSSACDFLSS